MRKTKTILERNNRITEMNNKVYKRTKQFFFSSLAWFYLHPICTCLSLHESI